MRIEINVYQSVNQTALVPVLESMNILFYLEVSSGMYRISYDEQFYGIHDGTSLKVMLKLAYFFYKEILSTLFLSFFN